MTLRALERLAVSGLLIGLGFVVADALAHRGPRYFWFIPFRRRALAGPWAFVTALWRSRPALAVGLLVIGVALLIALWTTIAVYRHARANRAGELAG